MSNNKNREALILDIEEYLKSDMPKYEALYLTSNDYKMILEALQAQTDIQAEADYWHKKSHRVFRCHCDDGRRW